MLSLYDYQLHCVNELDRLISGVLVAPTGSGKTMMGAALSWREVNRGGRVGFVVPRDNLAHQTAGTLRKWGLNSGLILGGEQENRSAKVQILSYQSLGSKRRSLNWLVDNTSLWIVDEAHITAFAESLQRPLENAKRKIGLTATPWQLSYRTLLDVFDNPVFAPPPGKLIEMGKLAQPIYFITKAKGKLGANASFIYQQWEEFSYDEKTFIFCGSIAHSDDTAEYFKSLGIQAVSVTSKTPKRQVEDAFDQFRSGSIRVLVSCNKLAEGCDIPDATCVILASTSDSKSGIFQRIGRGARIAPGKLTFKVIDCVGMIRKFGRFEDLNPTREDFLLEEPKEYQFMGKKCPICKAWNHIKARTCANCPHIFEFQLIPYDHPGELERLTSDSEARAIAAFHLMMLQNFREGKENCDQTFFKQYGYYPPDHWVSDAKLPGTMRSQPVNIAWRCFKQRISTKLPKGSVQLKIPGL